MLHTYACKTLNPGFFWYAVYTNLFRLRSKSINSKKYKHQLNRKKNQISDFFYFYFSRYSHFCDLVTPIFNEFFIVTRKMNLEEKFISFFIIFSTLRIIHKNRIKTKEMKGRGLHILSWENTHLFTFCTRRFFFIFKVSFCISSHIIVISGI